jgi:hypothetical protein
MRFVRKTEPHFINAYGESAKTDTFFAKTQEKQGFDVQNTLTKFSKNTVEFSPVSR